MPVVRPSVPASASRQMSYAPGVGAPTPNPLSKPMTYRGYYTNSAQYGEGDVVFIQNADPDEPFVYVCLVFVDQPGTQPPQNNLTFWQPLVPLSNGVAELNGATGVVSLASSDNSLTITSDGQTIDLKVPDVYTSLLWEGQTAPAIGNTTLASFDGSIQFSGEGGSGSTCYMTARQLGVQSVLDAGITADYLPVSNQAPNRAPATPIAFWTNNSGRAGFSTNWLSVAPVAPLVQNFTLLPGSVYLLSGLLNVVTTVCGEGMFANVALRIKGVADESDDLTLPGCPSVYQIVDAPAPVSGKSPYIGDFYVPVNLVFTCPSTVPVSGVNLGFDGYSEATVEGGTLTMTLQWIDSFSIIELYAGLDAGAPAMARSAPLARAPSKADAKRALAVAPPMMPVSALKAKASAKKASAKK